MTKASDGPVVCLIALFYGLATCMFYFLATGEGEVDPHAYVCGGVEPPAEYRGSNDGSGVWPYCLSFIPDVPTTQKRKSALRNFFDGRFPPSRPLCLMASSLLNDFTTEAPVYCYQGLKNQQQNPNAYLWHSAAHQSWVIDKTWDRSMMTKNDWWYKASDPSNNTAAATTSLRYLTRTIPSWNSISGSQIKVNITGCPKKLCYAPVYRGRMDFHDSQYPTEPKNRGLSLAWAIILSPYVILLVFSPVALLGSLIRSELSPNKTLWHFLQAILVLVFLHVMAAISSERELDSLYVLGIWYQHLFAGGFAHGCAHLVAAPRKLLMGGMAYLIYMTSIWSPIFLNRDITLARSINFFYPAQWFFTDALCRKRGDRVVSCNGFYSDSIIYWFLVLSQVSPGLALGFAWWQEAQLRAQSRGRIQDIKAKIAAIKRLEKRILEDKARNLELRSRHKTRSKERI